VETPDVEGLLQHEDPPSAIIAANDRMALGVIAAAIDYARSARTRRTRWPHRRPQVVGADPLDLQDTELILEPEQH
jgi:hypothetical protein